MKTVVYLVCNSRGVDRITKKRAPDLHGGEVAVKLTVNIPDKAFRTPFAEADLTIPETAVIHPTVDISIEDDLLPDSYDLELEVLKV